MGIKTTSMETQRMLYTWANLIVLTEDIQRSSILFEHEEEDGKKVVLFDVGPDTYPRPFNKELHEKAKKFLDDNKSWLKSA